MKIVILLCFFAFLISCTNNTSESILNTGSLPSQFITVNTARDTIIKTNGGAVLEIGKRSFSGGDGEVALEIKEAYTFEDMVKGGLTTQSNGQPLSSGGMIYVGAKEGVKLVKPIRVSLPTNNFDVKMKLFRGESKDGKMNWREPQSLEDSLQTYLETGKMLFHHYCRTCHIYESKYTGPAMQGLEVRGPWNSRKELIAFTKNPGAYIPRTCYTKHLAAEYGGQIMPAYGSERLTADTIDAAKEPALTEKDMNAIYDYLHNEDLKNTVDLNNSYNASCDDSCRRYDSVRFILEDRIAALNNNRQNLIASNRERVKYKRFDSTGTKPLTNTRDQAGVIEKVSPNDPEGISAPETKNIYYRFDIASLGWYNIDKLLDLPEEERITLKVKVEDSTPKLWDVFIAVPQHKMFDRGGLLADGTKYGFFTKDGRVALPVGTEIIVFVLGEVDGKVAFDYTKLVSTTNNEINLHPKLSTKEAFDKTLKEIILPGVNIKVNKSKNADEIRKVDETIKSEQSRLESFKPKNCDCDCGKPASTVVIDTTSFEKNVK